MQPDALDSRAIREILRACLESRDLISFTDSLGIARNESLETKAEALAVAYENDAALRPRISRLLSATTRSHLEQVRLSTEIELERLTLDLDSSHTQEFWGLIWAMTQDGRQSVRELAESEIEQYFARLEPPPQPEPPEDKTDLPAPPADDDSNAPALPALGGPDSESGSRDAESAGEIMTALRDIAEAVREVSERQAKSDRNLDALSRKIDQISEDGGGGEAGDSHAQRALTNLETLMDGLSARQREIKSVTLSELDALRTELGNLVSQEEEARRSLSALSARVVSLGNELRDTRLREILERVDANIKDLGSANRRLEASLGSRDETLRVMLENMKSSQGESLRTVGEILTQVESLTEQSETNENKAEGPDPVQALRETLEGRLGDLAGKLDRLADQQQGVEARLVAMAPEPEGEQASGESEALNALRQQLEGLDTRFGEWAGALEEIKSSLQKEPDSQPEPSPPAALMEGLEKLQSTVDEMKDKSPEPPDLSSVNTKLESLGEQIEELKFEREQVKDKVADLEDQVRSGVDQSPDSNSIQEHLSQLREGLEALASRLDAGLNDLKGPETSPTELPGHQADEEDIKTLRAENQRLMERCETLERCLEEESRREMEEILSDEITGEEGAPPSPQPEAPSAVDVSAEFEPETEAESKPDEETPSFESSDNTSAIEPEVQPDESIDELTSGDTSTADEEPADVEAASESDAEDLAEESDDTEPVAAPDAGIEPEVTEDPETSNWPTGAMEEPGEDEASDTEDHALPEDLAAALALPEDETDTDVEEAPEDPDPVDEDPYESPDPAPEPLPVPASEPASDEETYPVYNHELVVLIGGKRDYDTEYRETAENLGARLERYENLDSLDVHQITDLVMRSDVLVLINEALMTVGGARARQIAIENNRRCFLHHSAQPRSLRRFLVNLIETGQV